MNLEATIEEIHSVIRDWDGPVSVAYSGGKDSSAVLKLVVSSILRSPQLASKITVIYCDTRVENPILDHFVKSTLRDFKKELVALGSEARVKILFPALSQRYFVRVVGRGYPPPTTFFRWCTKDLRIRPVQTFMKKLGKRSLVIVGTRRGESAQRDRVMKRAGETSSEGPVVQRQMDGGVEAHLYLPIANYSVIDVWECLAELSIPAAIDVHRLAELYRHGGGECPMVRETRDQPCASARFGCWICTAVRRDRSGENLLAAGYTNLQPYHEFRGWLVSIRNDPKMRCKRRRNGSEGLGPFTLQARKTILQRVGELEAVIGQTIITKAEHKEISRLWRSDRRSSKYGALERAR